MAMGKVMFQELLLEGHQSRLVARWLVLFSFQAPPLFLFLLQLTANKEKKGMALWVKKQQIKFDC